MMTNMNMKITKTMSNMMHIIIRPFFWVFSAFTTSFKPSSTLTATYNSSHRHTQNTSAQVVRFSKIQKEEITEMETTTIVPNDNQ